MDPRKLGRLNQSSESVVNDRYWSFERKFRHVTIHGSGGTVGTTERMSSILIEDSWRTKGVFSFCFL